MKKYKYNQKPILVYDFCILQYNPEPQNLLTDAPVLSSIDENGFVKVCSVALNENVRIDKYENKNLK